MVLIKKFLLASILSASLISFSTADAKIILEDQGSFAIGGSTVKHSGTFSTENFLSPDGQYAYGDHLYTFYQIPVKAKKYPIIFQIKGSHF